MKIFTVEIKFNLIVVVIFVLMHFSCEQKISWLDYKELDIVRTSRDTTYYYDGELLNGMVKKFDYKGNCILEFNVKNGILNGNFIEFYIDGNVKLKSNYNRGKLDGKYISYFINKNINQETYYKDGLINGQRKTYWLNGSIKELSELKLGALKGECIFYYSNSQPRKKILFDKYGNRDGVWLDYFQNGNIKSEIEYKSGVIVSPMRKYDVNGNLLKESN